MEEVFCEPEYQNQGIVKQILHQIAAISSERGYLFEAVYGTNAVYNHLEYTYSLPNEEEGYSIILESETAGTDFTISEASDKDIPIMAKLYETNYARNLLTTAIGEKEIYHMKNIYVEGNFYVIKSFAGEICGFFHTQLEEKRIYMMELNNTVSYYKIRPYIINFYLQNGLERIPFKLGKSHPVYDVFNGFYQIKLLSELGFVKVRNIPRFLLGISSVLNKRLAASSYANCTGIFTVAMHNKCEAYQLEWLGGQLTNLTSVAQEHGEVDIEHDRFIKLLFGRVAAADMKEEYSMYYFQNNDFRNLFEIIFPKMQSHVVSVN